jgi:putative flippase GtrA
MGETLMIKRLLAKLNSGLGGEAVRYILVGLATTGVNYLIFFILGDVAHFDPHVSNITAIIISILFAYFANKLFVFRSKSDSIRQTWLEFLRFIGARLFTLLIDEGGLILFDLLVSDDAVFAQYKFLVKTATQVVVIVLNYVISKLLVFRNRR